MDNVVNIVWYADNVLRGTMNKPQWALSQKELRAYRFLRAYADHQLKRAANGQRLPMGFLVNKLEQEPEPEDWV